MRPKRDKGLGATLALAIAGLALLLPAVAGAAPSRYVYEKCDSVLPGGGTRDGTFTAVAGVPFKAENSCSEPGGFLKISQAGSLPFSSAASWALPMGAPPGGKMESIAITAAICNASNTQVYAFALQKNWASTCIPEVRTYPIDSSWGTNALISLGCTTSGGDGTGEGDPADENKGCDASPWIYAHYFAATEADPVAPTVSSLGGTLLAKGTVHGQQTLGAIAHDEGGGVSNVSVQVNGSSAAQPRVSECQTAVAHNSSVTGIVATALTPCPPDVATSWTLDTQAYPFRAGLNSVRVCASDFATLGDPNIACSAPRSLTLDNSCVESIAAGGSILSAKFRHSKGTAVTVGFGHGAALSGKLATAAGTPVSGATICIEQRVLGVRDNVENFAFVKTDASGRYTYRVPPGPNREVIVRYRHDATLLTRGLQYLSRTRPSLHASPTRLDNGHPVRFWGRLPGPKAGGNVVVLQANVVGSNRWITFRKATAGPGGKFHASYNFTSTTRSTHYRFRAVVPLQAGYPWVEGSSNPVKVLVSR